MSDLKFLENLLNGSEVKFVPMGQIISRAREKGKSNREIKTVYSVSNMHGLVKAEDFRDNTIHSEDTSNYTIVRQGMFAYNPARLNIGSIAFLKTDADGLVSPMYVVFSVNEEIATKEYIDFFIKSSYCMNKINSLTEEGARFRFDFERWDLIEVPIPSIDVQTKIVDILNTFTKLNTELITELASRKKQYNYYRDQLLHFEGRKVEWKTLGEVATIGTGSHDTQDAIADGEYIFYARGRDPLRLNEFDFDETAIITAGDGAGVGKVFHYAEGKYALHQRAYRIAPRPTMNPRFVYHCIKSHFYAYIQKASVSSSVTSLRRPMFLEFPIPVPSLTEQARIVAILDKFDALTESLIEGLPREIELRQKQYEHYRDLLLSFPKPEEVAA